MNDVAPRGAITDASVRTEQVPFDHAELLAQLTPLPDGPTCDAATTFASSALRRISALPPGVCDEDLIECLLAIAHYFYLANQRHIALKSANDALSHARRLDRKPLLRKALNLVGVMRMDGGDLPGATSSYAEALHIARQIRDEGQEAAVWQNVGAALLNAAQFEDALKCFERAASLARKSFRYAVVQSQALVNLSTGALHLGEITKGIEAVCRVIELLPEPVTSSECLIRANAEANYARLLIELGEVGSAQSHCKLAQLFVTKAPTARATYDVSVAAGLLEVHAGSADGGLARLKQSLEYARQSVPSQLRDALTVCIAAYETAGQPDVALVYLHEVLALNREAKAGELLMQQQLLTAGISLSGQSSDEAALISDAARLQTQVDARLQHLTNTAINAGLAAGHDLYRVFRVSRLAELFAQCEGWSSDRVREVALAAKLVDIGMIAAPEPLLTKTRGLSAAERKLMDDHTRFGAELLSGAKLVLLQPCIPVARFHHEKWDGSGAWALAGEAIPLEARLVTLCDAFDAMTHLRPWRPQPLSTAAALREIGGQAGRQFDPELAARFVDFVQREFWKHDDFSAYLGEEALGNEYVRARLQITRMMAGEDEARR